VSGESIRWRFQMAMRDDDSLSPNAKLVGSMLALRMKRDGRCDPGIARIAADSGLSENTVRDALAELEGRGDRDRRRPRHPSYAHLRRTVGGGRRRGGEGATNLYEATPWNPAPGAPLAQAPRTRRQSNPAPWEPFKNPARGAPEDVTKTVGPQGPKEPTPRAYAYAYEDDDELLDQLWAETRPRGAYWEPGS